MKHVHQYSLQLHKNIKIQVHVIQPVTDSAIHQKTQSKKDQIGSFLARETHHLCELNDFKEIWRRKVKTKKQKTFPLSFALTTSKL